MSIDFTLNNVYYVETDRSINPVAIRPHFHMEDGRITVMWNDTARGKVFRISRLDQKLDEKALQNAEHIDFETDKHQKVRLRILTKELFEKEVKKEVAGGVDDTSTETIRKHYLETAF